MSFEEACIHVWQASLVDGARAVIVGDTPFPVSASAKQKLRQVNFVIDGREFRGIEQNPLTKSRWAAMARSGKKVMQIVEGGRYVAVVVDGKFIPYKAAREGSEDGDL
jgi:hypothetical protein